MAASVHTLNVHIGDARSKQFIIELSGCKFTMANFTITQQLLDHTRLGFDLIKDPDESISDTQFQVCADIIGKEVELFLTTDSIDGNLKGFIVLNENADIKFKGYVSNANAYRTANAQYTIRVDCLSWDGLLEDGPDFDHWKEKTLDEIVEDQVGMVDKLDYNIDVSSNPENIKEYCVKWNETTWSFIQRLAVRHGEWLFNDGEQLIFGKMPEMDSVKLVYPQGNLVSYGVNLQTKHLNFSQVSSSDFEGREDKSLASYSEARSEKMNDVFNPLNEAAFNAMKEIDPHLTMEQLVSSGPEWYFKGIEAFLDSQQKPQAHGMKSSLLSYHGRSASSKICVGAKLTVVDNYITEAETGTKSDVPQDEILITFVAHTFSNDENYENTFRGLSANTKFPPYTNPAAVPRALPTRAWIADNNDPDNMGRVRVFYNVDWIKYKAGVYVKDEDLVTPWIRVVQPYTARSGGVGAFFIPEWGSEVIVDFEGGNAEMPYVRGSVYNGNQDLWRGYIGTDEGWPKYEDDKGRYSCVPDPEWAKSRDNQGEPNIKAIRTPSGHTVEFVDKGDGFDDQGYIRIYNKWDKHYEILLSADDDLVKIWSNKNIVLEAKNDIRMTAGGDITMNARHNIEEKAQKEMSLSSVKDMNISTNSNLAVIVNKNMTTTVGNNKTDNVSAQYELTMPIWEIKNQRYTNVEAKGHITVEANNQINLRSKTSMQLNGEKEMYIKGNTTTVSANDTTIFGQTTLTIKSPMTKEC